MSTLAHDLVPVRGRYVGLDGSAISGSVTFKASIPHALDPVAKTVVLGRTITVSLDGTGFFEVSLPATDDPDITPTGWTYQVVETFQGGGGGRTFNISVPLAAKAAGIELSTVAPSPPASGTPTAYVTLEAFNLLDSRVTDLEATPGGGVTDHGLLNGLDDDDHPQYHNNARGDVRYYTKTQVDDAIAAVSGGGASEIDPGLFTDRLYTLNVNQAGNGNTPAASIVTNLIVNGVPVRVKDLLVWVTTQASADAFVEVAIYDASDRSLVASWGTFNLNVSPANITLVRGSTILLPPAFVIAAKLRSASMNGGGYRAGLPRSSTFQHIGNPWDGLDSSIRGMVVAHAGTGAMPSVLPNTGWGLGSSVDLPPLIGFRPWT